MPRHRGKKPIQHEMPLDNNLKNNNAALAEKISSILANIIQLGTTCGTVVENPEETIITDLISALNNQPIEHRQYILAFARRFYDACYELYAPTLSTKHERNGKAQIDALNISENFQKNVDSHTDAITSASDQLEKKGGNLVDKNFNTSQGTGSVFDNHSSKGTVESDAAHGVESAASSSLTSLDSITTPSFKDYNIVDGDSDVDENGVNYLREQTIDEFIDDARDQLLRLGGAELPPQGSENFATLLDSLDDNNVSLPNGPEWYSLIEKGYGDRQRGTIYYALAAIGFENWHRLEVQQIMEFNPEKKLTMAKTEVSGVVLGPKPVTGIKKGEWDRRRKHLNTHLTRGRKWRRLVDVFSRGILFKDPWYVAGKKNTNE